jgi:hypothetical protein
MARLLQFLTCRNNTTQHVEIIENAKHVMQSRNTAGKVRSYLATFYRITLVTHSGKSVF